MTDHALKTEAANDFYSYITTSNQISIDEIEQKAFQPSDNELEIIFHVKQGFGTGEIFALAHYTYDPQGQLSSN